MKHEEFYQVFKVMAEYVGSQPSEALMEIYWHAFKDWSFSDFKKACQAVMQSLKYPRIPFMAEIREAVLGPLPDQTAIAYETLMKTMKRVGPWETVIFEDGAIARAVEAMGGWEEINSWTVDEWKFRKKDFDQLYLANLRRGQTEPLKLHGTFDRINGTTGIEGKNKPILVTRDVKFLPGGEVKQIK